MTVVFHVKIPTLGSLGFLCRMSFSMGSTPSANAGGISHMRFAQRIITGVNGTGRPTITDNSITQISAELQDSR